MNNQRLARWSFMLAALVGSFLRLVTLGRKSLWLDEVDTLQIAQTSVLDILTTRNDPHPPLYYLLMHYWITLGQSEFILRLPSAIAGIAAIALIYGLAREWLDEWGATACAWLLALAPLHIWYSQETRSYALTCTCGLVSAWAYLVAIKKHSWAWGIWVITTIIGLYLSYSFVLLLLVQLIIFGITVQNYKAHFKTSLFGISSLILVLLYYSPQIGIIQTQFAVNFDSIYYLMPLQQTLSNVGILVPLATLTSSFLLIGIVLLICAVIGTWFIAPRLNRFQSNTKIAALIIMIYWAVLLASITLRGLGIKRQFLVLLPYALVLVIALISVRANRQRLWAGLLIPTLLAAGLTSLALEQENWRGVAQQIDQQAQGNDVVLFNAGYTQMAFDYYDSKHLDGYGTAPQDVPLRLNLLTQKSTTVWLILANDNLADPQSTIRQWFDEHWALRHEYDFAGVRLREYNKLASQ